MDNQNQIILYQDDNDITRVSVRFADEDLWLTQNQLAEIYCTTQKNISMHIRNIYADNELDANRTYKDFLLLHFRHNLRHNLRRAKTFFKKIHSRGKLSKHYTSRVLYIPKAPYKIIVFIVFIIKAVILFTILLAHFK